MNIVPIELHGLDQWLGYAAGLLMSMVVQGEGREYYVLLFQLLKDRGKVTYDLNPLHHLDPRGLPLLLLTGWGWSNKKVIEPDYFPKTWIHRSLIPIAGTIPVLCLVGIIGTFYAFTHFAFLKAAVEATTILAVANFLIPIPPLALGRALFTPFSLYKQHELFIESLGIAGLTGIMGAAYFMDWPFVRDWIVNISMPISKWVLSM